jgi:hypothetical protein
MTASHPATLSPQRVQPGEAARRQSRASVERFTARRISSSSRLAWRTTFTSAPGKKAAAKAPVKVAAKKTAAKKPQKKAAKAPEAAAVTAQSAA